jgi:hypothetical protein
LVKNAGLPKDSVSILWESASPVRAAKARLAIGDLSRGSSDDTLIISVIVHTLLGQLNLNSASMKNMIRESAVLLRNGKNRVEASDVVFIETNDTIVRFLFPRQQAIQPGDKEVSFRFEMSDSLVEAKFNLREMVFHGQPAF